MTQDISTQEVKEVSEQQIISSKDLLGREQVAEKFLNIILGQEANVFSINAPWGAGKTFLLNLMENKANEREVIWVKYNAWESDYMDNPIQAIIEELTSILDEKYATRNDGTDLETFSRERLAINKAGKNIAHFLKEGTYQAGVNIKGVNLGLTVNPSNINEYRKLKALKQAFIGSIKYFSHNIAKDILIVIDELDRCRPTYAIRTLETLKHFFQGPNGENLGIKFVLAVDKKQLQNTVTVLYGTNADTDCYLRKFVDIEFHLKPADIKKFVKYLIENKRYNNKSVFERMEEKLNNYCYTFCAETQELVNSPIRHPSDIEEFVANMVRYCDAFDLKLRDIEKLLLKLNIILSEFDSKSEILFFDYLFILLALQIRESNLYDYYKTTAYTEFSPSTRNPIIKSFVNITGINIDSIIASLRAANYYTKNNKWQELNQEADSFSSHVRAVDYKVGTDLVRSFSRYFEKIDFTRELG